MKRFAHTVAALGMVALLLPALAVAADQQATVSCADCHDTVVAAFAANPHGRALGREQAADAVCISCHPGGREHADAGGDATLVRVPRGAAGIATCLTCHGGKSHNDIEPKSVHARAGVTCDACHGIHADGMPAEKLLKKPGSELCVSCHSDVRASFRKPNTHSMHESVNGSGGKAGMQCYSCHNPHGADDASLKVDRSGEVVCLSCHTDKRGPFVFSHPAEVLGSCQTCHEPHGSVNPHRLKRAQVSQLCLECHSRTGGSTMGSQPPSLHDLRSPRYQNCTTCHVAIHGSNSSPLLLR